ncbi:signal peptidase II [Corynebacterium pilosum]|uniref:Lipoprotein signal peptidase n=1 Tax=Corynebacterium pilosum TaxID=35756 RepID=A0A376CII2_9CORY|nr:signal peptidase II [Corynebacterium pilosum]STC68296.1 lipoprotein signal peptidase [Corynebacterium pilosum]
MVQVNRTSQRKKRERNYVGLMVAIIVIVALIDQAVKQLMLNWLEPGQAVAVIGDWFRFYLLFNPGAAFSMGQDSTWLFTTIQLVFVVGALIAAFFIRQPWYAVGIALIAGGALGNLCDRLFREPGFWFGHVVDYISVGNFAVFNLADASITIGVVVFVIAVFLDDSDKAEKQDAQEVKDGEAQ